MRVAVVGGGPGGLMAARLLEEKSSGACRVTLFEASDRLGGKIQTRRFAAAPATYEAGVAECYDYESVGPDPLKDLVRALGLTPVPTSSSTVAMNGVLLGDDHDLAAHVGPPTMAAIERFRCQAAAMMSRAHWYRGFGLDDNRHPWAERTVEEILDEVDDPVARRYLTITTHSDLATEPHLTNGLIGLRNFLKSVPGYGAQYRIEGGMELLPRRLAECLTATDVRLSAPVVGVAGRPDGRYDVAVRLGRQTVTGDFDAVVLALPYNLLRTIEWTGERLRRAVTRHVARYDRPAHYLRVSILFADPFWRQLVAGSWMMLDSFGGCCVYDERSGSDATCGVLGWLFAGADALALCNADDETLVARAIDTLPEALRANARGRVLEARVHRWAGALSGTPGGFPLRGARESHQPEPEEHGRLVVVGDYLFDSTLNGVLRSADIATGLALAQEAAPDVARARPAPRRDRHLPPSLTPGASRTSPAMR